VTAVRSADADGYSAVQLGFGDIDPRKVNKPKAGVFAKAGVTPRRYLVELRTDDASEYTLGQEVTAETFEAGEIIDVTATSKGKGFAGVMKRHGFHGLSSSHGTQRKHRSPGSIGGCAFPGHVFKGLKMAGRMGGERTTVLNLTLHGVDAGKGLLLIRGPFRPGWRPRAGPQRGQVTSRARVHERRVRLDEPGIERRGLQPAGNGIRGRGNRGDDGSGGG
jgi:large subunit ribosomal protein L3